MFERSKPKKPKDGRNENLLEQKKNPNNMNESLQKNIAMFQVIFEGDDTIMFREFQNKSMEAARCCIVYAEGMVNAEIINEDIILPVLRSDMSRGIESDNLLTEILSKVIITCSVSVERDVDKMVGAILYGDTVFMVDGYNQALVIKTKGWKSRSVTEPESAKVVRGPREGFTEAILVNLSLIRRKIKDPGLKFKFKEIGETTHTKTCICYIKNLASEGVLQELEERLDRIKIDGIIDSGYIQELIRDAPYSSFATVGCTERPDVIAAKLLEGRIALVVDGSPFVLTVPYLIVENFQVNEDYYNDYIFGTMNRLLRSVTAVTSITVPALFLSVVTYHQEMLPTPLLLSISASRQNVPIPTAVSLFLMLFIFDILREVGNRMPAPIGQAINIVGSLVLGQAAVEAKLVSAPVLIVTAITGITSLLNINFISSTIIYRTFLLIGASFLGVYGFLLCFIALFLHLASIRSFGVPYMLNVTRVKVQDAKDAWVRAPWWVMIQRPRIIAEKDTVREVPNRSKENQPK